MKQEQLSPDKRKVKLLAPSPLKQRERQRLTASPQGNTHRAVKQGAEGGEATAQSNKWGHKLTSHSLALISTWLLRALAEILHAAKSLNQVISSGALFSRYEEVNTGEGNLESALHLTDILLITSLPHFLFFFLSNKQIDCL